MTTVYLYIQAGNLTMRSGYRMTTLHSLYSVWEAEITSWIRSVYVLFVAYILVRGFTYQRACTGSGQSYLASINLQYHNQAV